jgi:hypothetical protein
MRRVPIRKPFRVQVFDVEGMNVNCVEMKVMVWIPHIRDSLEVVYSVFPLLPLV